MCAKPSAASAFGGAAPGHPRHDVIATRSGFVATSAASRRGCRTWSTFAVSDAASDRVRGDQNQRALADGAGSVLELGGGQEAGPRETGCINR